MKKKHKKETYWLDLADNGYWLIKNETGYRECVGVGDEGKKAALEKIERLTKGGKNGYVNHEDYRRKHRSFTYCRMDNNTVYISEKK